MRVTDSMKSASVMQNLAKLQAEQFKRSQEAATGVRLHAPSVDPIAAAEAVKIKSSMARTEAHRSTIKMVEGDVRQAESTLAEADNLMKRVHELAVQGANDSLDANERALLAIEVRNLKEQLVDMANTKGSRGYLFSGSQVETATVDATGIFQGDDLDQLVELGPGLVKAVNVSGARAFTVAGGRDVFADLDTLEAGLLANDRTVIAQSIDDVELSRDQIVQEQARAGLTMRQLETSDFILESVELDLGRREQDTAAADPIEAYSKLNELGSSLEQAISVARTVLGSSLIERF